MSNYKIEETAGRIMTTKIPTVGLNDTAQDIHKQLKTQIQNYESINYLYVVNKKNILQGVISIKELHYLDADKRASQVMSRELVTAKLHTDQERVALLAIKYNIKAIPVIDSNGVFQGVVTSDTILNVLHNEDIEDTLKSVGIRNIDNPAINIIKANAITHFNKRAPWLLGGLAGGLLAAYTVKQFESYLEAQILLAAFIPTIVYMADAVGSQTQTIFIRSLSLQNTLNIGKYITREINIVFLLALVLGVFSVLLGAIVLQALNLGLILGVSIFFTIIMASVIAVLLPLILSKLKIDPAIASGPFATVIRDILSLLIYFLVISVLV
ncbi:magnesium transporter [bacterium]|nr:magnesium transporter [Candidatus Elulimicrobium humile]